MMLTAARAIVSARTSALGLAATLAAALPAVVHHEAMWLVHLLLSFGLLGVLLVAIVDASFVPLPIPGITDLLVVILAARHTNIFFLVGAATVGSFLGGAFSYQVGQTGGLALLERHVPPRIFQTVCNWMQTHAILSVALPAIMPPPMPLSPFVLAAGALNMSRRKFLTTFTLSRFLRHATVAALGVHYGPHILHLWNLFTRKWNTEILIAIWSTISISVAFAFYRLYKTNRALSEQSQASRDPRAATPTAQV
jgi:membrane protein YqaA with SNARE-associated domain